MPTTSSTSTGHEASDAGWLDLHFESSRPEYEQALRAVGIHAGWSVLDAGCGGGSFLPLICDLVGATGSVDAIDLAPENIDRVLSSIDRGAYAAPVKTAIGSVLSLPYADASFDCVWSANVMQYLTPEQFRQSVDEAMRVLKPGGLLAVKDFDSTLLQVLPLDRGMFSRFMAVRLRTFRQKGVLGTDCGSTLPRRLRQQGLDVMSREGSLVERWAPVSRFTRDYVRDLITYFASVAPSYALPESDQHAWRELAAEPEGIFEDADFCYREFFVMVVCRKQ